MNEATQPNGHHDDHKPRPVHFTEDGLPLEIETDALPMSEVLALIGKSSDEWYLVEKRGREREDFRDPAQIVEIREGAKFVAVFTGPTPVS
jgi:hypothetical protein